MATGVRAAPLIGCHSASAQALWARPVLPMRDAHCTQKGTSGAVGRTLHPAGKGQPTLTGEAKRPRTASGTTLQDFVFFDP